MLEQLLKTAKSQDDNFMNIEDGFHLTPVWTAIYCDNSKCLPLLIQYGAAVEKRNQAGLTPLTEATSNEMCLALLACKADGQRSAAEPVELLRRCAVRHSESLHPVQAARIVNQTRDPR
jgi:hypothetical protein